MIKVKKLTESSSDAKNISDKFGRKPEYPYAAFESAKNVKQMDDAVAWALNEVTSTNIGDSLEKGLTQGTLTSFIRAFHWDEMNKYLSKKSNPEGNAFFHLLKKYSNTWKNPGSGKSQEYLFNSYNFSLLYNGYVADKYNKEAVDKLTLAELLEICSGNSKSYSNNDVEKIKKLYAELSDRDKNLAKEFISNENNS